MTLDILQIPVLSDNYVYLLHDRKEGVTAVVDPAVADPVLKTLEEKGWTLDYILNTHHHADHVGGNRELVEKTGCTVIGPKADAARIPCINGEVKESDIVQVGASTARVFDVPGHTRGHIAYWFVENQALFCGDTLFAMGCGRLFEGTPKQMWQSLQKFLKLPDETRIYCAHEYTLANGQFALSIDPDNSDLKKRMHEVRNLREKNLSTIPSTMGLEKKTNPFLRPMNKNIRENLGLQDAKDVDVFAQVRHRKDNF